MEPMEEVPLIGLGESELDRAGYQIHATAGHIQKLLSLASSKTYHVNCHRNSGI